MAESLQNLKRRIGGVKNEFPLKTLSFDPNWFDQTFEEKGSGLSNSHTGLEIGEGMSINALFAWLAIKYETYQATLDLRIIVDAPLASRHEYRVVQVKGSGFFFDISGAYQGYSAGIRVARRDAMLQSFIRAIDGAYAAVERAVEGLPLAGRIDVVLADGTILVGTGFDSQIRSGVFFQVVDDPSVIIEVTGQSTQGSVGRIVRGNPELAKPGKIVRQIYRLPREGGPASFASALVNEAEGGEPVLAAVEKIELPAKNLHKSDFKDGEAPDVSWVQAFFKNIIESVTLPYRIWRYFRYDVAYQRTADSSGGYGPGEEGPPSETPVDWSVRSRDEWWAVKTGLWLLEVEPPLGVKGAPVVAVIDTGVDYNHPAVHDALWLNPFPLLDTRGYQDRYGWDFISGDGRPFDDAYHGTWMASAVTAVIPSAKIMPLKVFNPWGITNSGALYGAFVYAVDHGAQIILCGWATRHQSAAIDKGVAYASTHGVVVVAAAGDRGDELANNPAYPASLSGRYDNVVTVTGVDEYDTLVKEYGRYANHGSKAVTLAAPGKSVLVAAPRQREMRETSTAIASALVAGALARIWVAHPGCGGHVCLLDALKASADPVPALQGSVSGGLRLRFRD